MTQELFDIYLTGRLLSGHNRKEVIVNLAQLTDRTVPEAAALLDAATCVQAGIDQTAAEEYREILEETGAEAVVRACVGFSEVVAVAAAMQPAAVPPPAPTAPAPTSQAGSEFEAEETPVLDADAPFVGLHMPELADRPDAEPWPPAMTLPPAAVETAPRARKPRRTRILALALGGSVLVIGVAALLWFGLRPATPGAHLAVVGETLNLAQPYQQQVEQFWRQHGTPPSSLSDLNLAAPAALAELATLIPDRQGRLLIQFGAGAGSIAGSTLALTPVLGDTGVEWQCGGGTLAQAERPPECRDSSILQ